jgi:16S rRNA U516 pseudouridylate synthase RsuA-like enzyme
MPVGKIKRVRIGPLKLGKLRSGEWRYLTEREVQKLMEYTTVKKPTGKS